MNLIFRKMRDMFRPSEHDTAPASVRRDQDNALFGSSARASELVRRVDPAEFRLTRDCHVLICPAGRVALTAPRVVNGQVPDFRIQEPDGIPHPLPHFPTQCAYPDLTISRLDGTLCVPGGVAISRDRRIIAESFTCYWDRRFHHSLAKSPAGYRLKSPITTITHLPGKYLYLDFQHLSHYGHFIADVLPRLWAYYYLRDCINISDVKILISRKPERFIRDILDVADLGTQNIVEIDEPVTVDELFIATKALQLQDYAAPILRQVWTTIGSRAATRRDGPKRVYLARSRHPQRQLLNELDVEAIFSAKGFQIVHPEGLTFREQVDLVTGADLLAGPSGSNLFTLAFQREMRSAFIITSPKLIHITDSLLQVGQSCDLRTYIGQSATTHPSYQEHWVHSPWFIEDLPDLDQAVTDWLHDHD